MYLISYEWAWIIASENWQEKKIRPEIKERLYKYLTYQEVDRIPDVEFGYWPQTIRRWLKEGMPISLTKDERNEMFLGKLDDFFRFDSYGCRLPTPIHMNPAYEEEELGHRGDVTIMRGTDGIIA